MQEDVSRKRWVVYRVVRDLRIEQLTQTGSRY
jgi:hypothetical protein